MNSSAARRTAVPYCKWRSPCRCPSRMRRRFADRSRMDMPAANAAAPDAAAIQDDGSGQETPQATGNDQTGSVTTASPVDRSPLIVEDTEPGAPCAVGRGRAERQRHEKNDALPRRQIAALGPIASRNRRRTGRSACGGAAAGCAISAQASAPQIVRRHLLVKRRPAVDGGAERSPQSSPFTKPCRDRRKRD